MIIHNVWEVVISAITRLVGNEVHIDLDSTPSSLGLDSLDAVEVIMNIERDLSISLDDESIERCNSVGDLIRCLTKKFPSTDLEKIENSLRLEINGK